MQKENQIESKIRMLLMVTGILLIGRNRASERGTHGI